GSSFANGDASSKLSAPDLRPETPWQCRAGKDAATAHVCSISFEQRVDNCNPAAGRMQRRASGATNGGYERADMRGNTDETWSRTLDWWARPCHHPQARADDGRRRDRDERAGQGLGVHGAFAERHGCTLTPQHTSYLVRLGPRTHKRDNRDRNFTGFSVAG